MPEKSPIGSWVIAIWYRTLPWAVTEIVRTLSFDQISKLKVSSGEHLAAILITSFLGVAPRSVDTAGETDLMFEIPQALPGDALGRRLGLGNEPFADFEIKSLPGGFRKYDAAIDRKRNSGEESDRFFKVTVASMNTVLREARPTILKAKEQLEKKGKAGHSKNIFLIAHFFEHFTMECLESPLIAHFLEPLGDLEDIASVWVLWAPTHLVVWSAEHQEWTNLIFKGVNQNEVDPGYDESLELLQHVECEFLEQTNCPKGSPYVFGITTAGEKVDDNRPEPDHTTGT